MMIGLEGAYDSQILAAIPQYCPSCPPALVLALVQQESGGNQFTSSGTVLTGSSNDMGLFQIIPQTAAGLNIDPTTVQGNIQGGLTLLQQDYNAEGNWTAALEAYNDGPTGLANQLAAGQTPASAGYASSILAAAGMSDSGAAVPVTGQYAVPLDTSDTVDTSDTGGDGSDGTDTSGSTGGLSALAWAGILAGVGLFAYAVS